MKREQLIKLTFFVILILGTINHAFALGVAPSKIIQDFSADLQQEFSFSILNGDNKDIDVIIYPRGDLADYVTIEKNSMHILASQKEVQVRYKVNIPYSVRKPGVNPIEVVVEETPSNYNQQTVIGGKLAVVHQLLLNAPYLGSYASLKFTANNPDSEENLVFAYTLFNEGSETIDKFHADLEVYDSNHVFIGTRSYDFNSLEPGAYRKEERNFDGTLTPGNYYALVRVLYNGKIMTEETAFTIGKPYIDINGIGSSNFKLGGINKIDISVYNNWFEILKDVSADISVKDKRGSVISIFKTLSIDVPAFTGNNLLGYWDTSGITAGDYVLSIVAHFNGKTSQRDFEIQVLPDQLLAKGVSLSGNVVAGKKSSLDSTVSILILAFIILMIVNVALIVYLRKGKRPPQLENIGTINMILFGTVIVALHLLR